MLLMPMLYLPPLSYMALLCAAEHICIEAQENYIKSTYRNRCEIIGSNGVIDLSIPLAGGRDHHHAYPESQISNITDWQHRHRMSILSCYGNAPFFEHYMPYLDPFYQKEYKYLFDYNKQLLQLLIKLMKLKVSLSYSDVYEKNPTAQTDLRKVFKPGRITSDVAIGQNSYRLQYVPYIRVFDSEHDFLSLSCLDLLFNEGPQSKNILQGMLVSS